MERLNGTLSTIQDNLAIQIFGTSLTEAHEKGICIKCKEESQPKCHTLDGVTNYRISGLCEECYNSIVTGE